MRWNGKESVGVAHDTATILFVCLHKLPSFSDRCFVGVANYLPFSIYNFTFWISHSKFVIILLVMEITRLHFIPYNIIVQSNY